MNDRGILSCATLPRATFPALMLALALPVVGLVACDPGELLEVEDPDVVAPEEVDGPEALPAARANALGDFAVAYVGSPNGEGQILITALVGDEFIHTGTFDTRESIDRRIIPRTNPHVEGTFRGLHRARVSAERAADLFAEYDPNTPEHAEVLSLAGFAYVMFGENYCSGVPFSRIAGDGQLEFGEPETTTQVFDRALARFDAALALAAEAGSADQENLARVGRARSLLGLGDYEAAAEAAAAVPTGFERVIFHSETTTRQNNGVWSLNNDAGRWSVADRAGGNGLPFRSDGDIDGAARDPRIPTAQIGLAQRIALRDRGEHWGQLKYPERASSTVLAGGVEARLIEAEAALRRGDPGVPAFVDLHSNLRTAVGLAALNAGEVQQMSPEERVDLHFRERAYWLWLTSHRLGDLRRLMWDYSRQQDEIFPIGQHHRAGAPYGQATNLPIPFDEENNPRSEACFVDDDHQGRDS